MSAKNPYSVLGVATDATKDEIRAAYRKLAHQYHPDVNPDDDAAEERFKEISAAYGVLSDDEKRARFDEFGEVGLRDGFDAEQARRYGAFSHGGVGHSAGSNGGIDEMLRNLFGGGQRPRGPQRGGDARGEIAVDFLDAVRGGNVTVQFEGKGALKVTIPAGADDGTRIRLSGQGQPGHGNAPPGDLYLTLRVRPHPFFTRDGADLYVDVPVTLSELVLGASIEVPTPEGNVTMTIPPKSSNGRKLRLRGRGASRVRSSDRGDLYVTLALALPDLNDPRVAELATEMESLYGDTDLRAHLSVRSSTAEK